MNPLYRNDTRGEHAPSWYAASLPPEPLRPELQGAHRADVVIIGAGYTGLWAALTLARAGRKVMLLEAHRVGFGASGRNGGQVQSGFNKPQSWLESRLGQSTARALWDMSEAAKDQLRDFCTTHAPEAAFRPGLAHGEYRLADLDHLRAEADHMAHHYGQDITIMERAAFGALVKSPLYVGGGFDPSGGHLHPLAYARALARAAEAAGAVIYETTEVLSVTPGAKIVLTTPKGQVTAGHVIVAGNGYLPNILPAVNARVMPINSFIAATDPLPDRWQDVLADDIAVSDSKFVVNYYRFSAERRFLFGGRESYSIAYPRDIKTALVARMLRLFPQLAGVGITHVWGGALGITMSRLPHVAQVAPNIISGAGFSGHGVALSGMAGRVMAQAVMGQEDGLTTLAALPVGRFPGGAGLRAPILTLAMTWFALRDRLGV
ncbi:NAD(P)/FAD-dependent oxidoreductase [Roseicyclus sp.]|uniref:NAD(P)/FAD-dependent oxidoreductase n=1 Tax=Roseicyclus sp. TaxID=1914329 RepID=UPI003F6C4A9D